MRYITGLYMLVIRVNAESVSTKNTERRLIMILRLCFRNSQYLVYLVNMKWTPITSFTRTQYFDIVACATDAHSCRVGSDVGRQARSARLPRLEPRRRERSLARLDKSEDASCNRAGPGSRARLIGGCPTVAPASGITPAGPLSVWAAMFCYTIAARSSHSYNHKPRRHRQLV